MTSKFAMAFWCARAHTHYLPCHSHRARPLAALDLGE
jgi:hypothetical protein